MSTIPAWNTMVLLLAAVALRIAGMVTWAEGAAWMALGALFYAACYYSWHVWR